MPRHINPPKTIAERGGLKAYLDETASQHNGLCYRDFIYRINPERKHKVSKTIIAEDFGVNVSTIYSWLNIHKTEQIATFHPDSE